MTYYIKHGDSLSHYGLKGMKWGVRRFQNEDGSLTEAGKQRYGLSKGTTAKESVKSFRKLDKMGANVEFEQNRLARKNLTLDTKQKKQAAKIITAKDEKHRQKAEAKLESIKQKINANNEAYGKLELSNVNISNNQWRHIGNLLSKRMDVSVKQRAAYAMNGKAYARMLLYGYPSIVVSAYTGDANFVQRNKIKARKAPESRDPYLRIKTN